MISVAQKASFHEILTILSKHGLLDHLILIGSWAEFIYEASGILGTLKRICVLVTMIFCSQCSQAIAAGEFERDSEFAWLDCDG
jgi:hypothetical protein